MLRGPTSTRATIAAARRRDVGNIQFRDNKILFGETGKIAMHEDCCCGSSQTVLLYLPVMTNNGCNDCVSGLSDTGPYDMGEPVDSGSGYCEWTYTFPANSACGASSIVLRATYYSTMILYEAWLYLSSGTLYFTRNRTVSEPAECELFTQSLGIGTNNSGCFVASGLGVDIYVS